MNEHTNIKPPPLLPEDFQRVFDAWETVGVMVFNSIHGKIAQEALTRCARPTPPEGVMSAKDLYYWLQLPEARHKHNADVIISAIKARDAQLSQAKGGQPEWYIDEDNEGREDWTDVLCDAHTLRPYSVRGAIEVTQQYAVLFPSRNDEDDDSQKLFETLEDAEKAIEEYKIAASVTVTTEFPVRAGADASLTAPQAPGEGE